MTAEEQYLIEQIRRLQEQCERDCQPYLDRLVQIRRLDTTVRLKVDVFTMLPPK